MIYTHLAVALVSASLAGIGAWKIQSWRFGNERAGWDKAVATAQVRALEMRIENQSKKDLANDKRLKTIAGNAAAAERARFAADSLRIASERSLQSATADHSACVVSASTHAKLLDYCERSYRGMAQTADGHATDVKALNEAWPK